MGQEQYAMNEHIHSNSTRNIDARGSSSEQIYAAGEARERGIAQAGVAQARKCGLDTGSRGWRYVYQTH